MAHTVPDYTSKYKLIGIFQNQDLMEIPARLGSPVTYDRRGSVLWYDDFEQAVLHWDISGAIAPGTAVLSAEQAYTKSQSCKYTTRDQIADPWGIIRWFPIPRANRVGAEMSFTASEHIGEIIFSLVTYSATNTYVASIKIDITNDVLEYNDDGGNWVEFADTLRLRGSDVAFNTCKVVMDMTTGYYARFLFNDRSFDLSNYGMEDLGTVGTGNSSVGITAAPDEAAEHDFYIDNVIVTQNEP